MASPPVSLVVFSDLDGSLLDHTTYEHAAAGEALALLRTRGIPLVLATSKTAAEVAPLRDALGFADCPAIVENGAGVLPPNAPDVGSAAGAPAEGSPYTRLRSILAAMPAELRAPFTGFGDLSPDALAAQTGLTRDAAERAGRRAFSEPGIWRGDAAARADFERWLARRGVEVTEGGRFLSLSFGGTKAERMREMVAGYARHGGRPTVIALGDAPNDVDMITEADFGVIIRNDHHAPLPRLEGEASGRIVRTALPGPRGWNEAVIDLVTRLGTRAAGDG